MPIYSLPDNNQQYEHLHRPTDHWSPGDRALLISSVALGALLVAVGTLGVLGHYGYNLGPFNVLSAKLGITPYLLGAFGGGALLLTTLAVASVKSYQDYTEAQDVLKTLTTHGADHVQALKQRTPLHMKQLTEGLNNYFTRGVFGTYHVLYFENNVYVFASKAGCDKQAAIFSKQGKMEDSEDTKLYPPDTTELSIMDTQLFKVVYEEVNTPTLVYDSQKGKYVTRSIKTLIPKNVPDKTVRERVPFDRLRLGGGITLTALSIAAIIIPFFFRFQMGYALQMFGIGSTAVMLYGAAAGLLLAKRSDEFVKKGHDKYFRRISKSDSKYRNGLGWGVSRAFFMALLAGGLLAAAGCAMHQFSINPLFVAPPLVVGAIALLAYTHFKGKERKEAWEKGCSIDMKKAYDAKLATTPASFASAGTTTEPLDTETFTGNRLVKSEKIVICDLTEIQNRTAFEGAKRQYNLSTYLLPLLALILVTALVGTRLFLWKGPMPRLV